MKGAEALAVAARMLRAAKIDGPERDARWLLAAALGIERDRLPLFLPELIGGEAEAAYMDMVAERAKRRPMSHILGGREFYGRWFKVVPDVLDPRPETEVVVAAALEEPFSTVLDLGVGSGAILLTLLAERVESTGVGVDISEAALEVAEHNAKALAVEDRLRLARADWYSGIDGRFELVVSNPPYVADHEIAGLAPEVREYEPRAALSEGGDGLSAYRTIIAGLPDHMMPGGRVILEVAPARADAVSGLLKEAGLHGIGVIRDLDGRERVLVAQSG